MDGIAIAGCSYATRLTGCDDGVLVLDRFVPWRDAVVGSPYVYVVHPSNRGDYLAQAVPEPCGDAALPFPPGWRGATAGELRRMTRIGDLLACNRSGSLCVAKTLDAAMEAARLSLAGDWHHCFECPRPCAFCV